MAIRSVHTILRHTHHFGVRGGWGLGLVIGVGVLMLPDPTVHLHGLPEGVGLLVQLVDGDEQPYEIIASSRR